MLEKHRQYGLARYPAQAILLGGSALLLCSLLVLSAFPASFGLRRAAPAAPPSTAPQAAAQARGVSLGLLGENGALRYRISSTALRYREDRHIELEEPRLAILRELDSWRIAAAHGVLAPDNSELLLGGGVRAQNSGAKPVHLSADTAHWRRSDEALRLSAPVRVHSPPSGTAGAPLLLHAQSAYIDTHTGALHLSDIQAQHATP